MSWRKGGLLAVGGELVGKGVEAVVFMVGWGLLDGFFVVLFRVGEGLGVRWGRGVVVRRVDR